VGIVREGERGRDFGEGRGMTSGAHGEGGGGLTATRSTRVGSGGSWAARGEGRLGRRPGRARGGAAGPPSQPAQGERGEGGLGCARKPAQERRGGSFLFSISY
jgi:hypothetical protein